MDNSNSATSRLVEDVASRHGVSTEAVRVLLQAVAAGGGTMAQFSHPELGGMGQWSRGGMLMIGDMFNQGLKFRVDNLCNELSDALARDPSLAPAHPSRSGGFGGNWWPKEFGSPSSSGAQNDMRYAFFPGTRRLVIGAHGETTTYDTGEHMISGVSQQQSGSQSLVFTSQFGTVRLEDLHKIGGESRPETQRQDVSRQSEPGEADFIAAPEPVPRAELQAAAVEPVGHDEIFAKIERLADLRAKGILTDEEFAAKKTELLARL